MELIPIVMVLGLRTETLIRILIATHIPILIAIHTITIRLGFSPLVHLINRSFTGAVFLSH